MSRKRVRQEESEEQKGKTRMEEMRNCETYHSKIVKHSNKKHQKRMKKERAKKKTQWN